MLQQSRWNWQPKHGFPQSSSDAQDSAPFDLHHSLKVGEPEFGPGVQPKHENL